MNIKKTINLLVTTLNQPTKFRTKNRVKINDVSRGTYNTYSQIKFKNLMLRSSLCGYSNEYILVKITITVPNIGTAAAPDNKNKRVMFKNCATFTDCISKMNNPQVDHAKDIDVVMPVCNLIEYSYFYLKTSASLWKYYKDKPPINNADGIIDFPNDDNNIVSFKFKQKITDGKGNDGKKDVEIRVPFKSLVNIWRTQDIQLVNCETNFILTWSVNCFIIANLLKNQVPTFETTDTKLYVLLLSLSTQDNVKLLQQLKSSFKRIINYNNYQLKARILTQNQYLDYKIDPHFQ